MSRFEHRPTVYAVLLAVGGLVTAARILCRAVDDMTTLPAVRR